ncbi:MAG: hypothetical protein ICV54_05170 [Nostoc sp. C3-bin3]|nr:hypothetical protein [Nostoc sp. C3-bin3]
MHSIGFYYQKFLDFYKAKFSDRYGRRAILLLTLFGSVIAYAGLGFAKSLWILLQIKNYELL